MHRKVSNVGRLSCDLLACMAMPQTGQWRIGDKGRGVITAPSVPSSDRVLIQIKSLPARRRRQGAVQNKCEMT
jgi:hypothetical protein